LAILLFVFTTSDYPFGIFKRSGNYTKRNRTAVILISECTVDEKGLYEQHKAA
jgi:hypothetical protein